MRKFSLSYFVGGINSIAEPGFVWVPSSSTLPQRTCINQRRSLKKWCGIKSVVVAVLYFVYDSVACPFLDI